MTDEHKDNFRSGWNEAISHLINLFAPVMARLGVDPKSALKAIEAMEDQRDQLIIQEECTLCQGESPLLCPHCKAALVRRDD